MKSGYYRIYFKLPYISTIGGIYMSDDLKIKMYSFTVLCNMKDIIESEHFSLL